MDATFSHHLFLFSYVIKKYKDNPKHDHHHLFYISVSNLKNLKIILNKIILNKIILNKITYSVLGCFMFLNVKKN